MTQGPQQPEHQGPPPAMYPPVPGPPRRSNKTALIIVTMVAVVIALVAVVALAFSLTPSEGAENTTGTSAAASSAAANTEDFRFRGTLKSKASVCSAAALTSQQIPKFAKDLDYSNRPNLDSDITKARQDLSRLASRISPSAESPIGPTVQDWITTYVDLLASYSRREPPQDVKWKGDLVDDTAARMNQMCKSE